MNNLNLDKYLNIVNKEKVKRGLDTYIPLYPMLRVQDGMLYVSVLLTREEDNVWDKEGNVKAEYWVLIDISNDEIVSFNKTIEKDFVVGSLIPKNREEKEKELSLYTVKKTLEYKDYLIKDIKEEELPLQKKLSSILDKNIEIDGDIVNINEYLLSNLEEEIEEKVNALVNVLVESKFGAYTFYYDKLFSMIIDSYSKDKVIDNEKIKLCIKIMNYYYDGVIGIDNLFNIEE